MPDLLGSPADRDLLVRRITSALRDAAPASRVDLRGSLAEHRADLYSDIDLRWTVPDHDFPALAAAVRTILSPVQPILSLRSDPDFQLSPQRRLLFVLFDGVPLFWRLDLELRTASPTTPDPTAPGTDWSLPASALANATAAIKALLRGHPDTAHGLLDRGFTRTGVSRDRIGEHWLTDIVALTDAAEGQEPELAPLAARVRALATGLLR